MIIKLKDEEVAKIIHQITVDNYMEFESCFCAGGEFYVGNINNKNTYLRIKTNCSKGCDNKFYKVNIFIAQQCTDESLLDKYEKWLEYPYDQVLCKDIENLFPHNYDDVILEKVNHIKLNKDDEQYLREYFYEKYKEWYHVDPFEYDENFKI